MEFWLNMHTNFGIQTLLLFFNAFFYVLVLLFIDTARVIGQSSNAVTNSHPCVERPLPRYVAKRRGKKNTIRSNNNFRLEDVPNEPHTLGAPTLCRHCGAKKFERERKGFCCSDGQIVLASSCVPNELYDLFESGSDEAQTFRNYIRTYNSNFSFTSLGVNYDKTLCGLEKGIYTFRVQGQIYHFINELIPTSGPPSFLQLYFYDTAHELEHRLNFSDNMTAAITGKIIALLKINPFCKFFRNLRDVPNLENHKIQVRCDPGLDQRVYNAPTVSQVAAIWVDGNPSADYQLRDIVVSGHAGESHRIHYSFGCYDPLQYPLLFPYGDIGWHQNIPRARQRASVTTLTNEISIDLCEVSSVAELLGRENTNLEEKCARSSVSCREYYCYKLQIRPSERSILLNAGRLLQQYVVDMYVKIETARLNFIRDNQKEIRADLYRGILDTLEMGETRGYKSGKRMILPASFIGGPRDMRKRYMDAMALVQRFGKPDLFLTMTCNPNWREIKEELGPNDLVQNRPDLVSRIFRAKLEELKHDLFKKQIFGQVAAYVYVIEFQKRGLPHAHLLVILRSMSKLVDPTRFDSVVSAEIPLENEQPYLYSLVARHMMHGPCGALNPKNVCMKKQGKCRSYYPKSFCSSTGYDEDSYPRYRRRNDGRTVKVRGHYLDNKWVVPYNPFLLAKFDCHINVEICSTIKAVKYLYKYVYKGHDRVCFSVQSGDAAQDINEIELYQSGRWISPPEAMWRIFGFILNEVHPSVVPLQLHLPEDQLVTFQGTDDLSLVVNNGFVKKSMLTEFFKMNATNEKARTLLYREFPEYFVWNKQQRIWTERKKHEVIGRVITASPLEGERYYLRLLLSHIRGPASYDELKTVNGIHAPSFREAALLHGLLQGDNYCELCLQEASVYGMPFELRRLFATILAYCAPNDPKLLWVKFKELLCQDYVHADLMPNDIEFRALQNIDSFLETMGKNINDYGLVTYRVELDLHESIAKVISEELEINVSDDDLRCVGNLNMKQKYAFDRIMEKVCAGEQGMFFIDGPGGSGKTYLYRALLAAVRSQNYVALATASSGVAAGMLPGGRTSHSRFKIPLQLDEDTSCNVTKQSTLASLFRMAKLIIWDEAPMLHRRAVEALDRTLQDVNECDLHFGGKVVVLGGDFRQVLPVILRGTKNDVIKASLVNSRLWKSFTKIDLTENMRARSDYTFSEYLLRIGNGEEECDALGQIQLPDHMVLHFEDDVSSLKQLIDIVFPDLNTYPDKLDSMINRVILTPKNDYVDQINDLLMAQFPGVDVRYYSFDEVLDKTEQTLQQDFLNTLTPNGIPPHVLTLKKDCPVMLLRNINAAEGLCNGTRLICREFHRNVIGAEIASGAYSGKKVFLPRIPFIPIENRMDPFSFKRTQFPIRPCFAMTINKAQGQTLDFVGLYLPEPVFSHGQLYVALSRAKEAHSVKILIKTNLDDCSAQSRTKNVVYDEVLTLAKCPSLTTN